MGKRLEQVISWALIAALTVQPALLHAQSIQVVGPDNGPRPHVDQSYNGTTVLNIETPNGAGVSHDVYTEFEANDLILNNSATNVETQLGGWIEGNPNLAPGQAADLWIGEVVGGNQTQLNGILEVGGQTMDVVLANEFGITCNGCGFVNTSRTTLTTGTPRFDSDGSLSGFDVKQGTVTIGTGGLNPDSRLSLADTSRVDVIARAAAIYGAMRADQLNVVAGANIVDYNWSYDTETGAVTGITEQAGTGTAPALAVDVAALGGMYANAIQMVATENGVGVRLNGEMASSTNIALRADGQLTLGAASGTHVPQIKAREQVIIRNQGPLLLEGSITSENGNLIDIRTSSGTLTFTGQADGGAITLESAGLANITAAITASDALKVTSLTGSVTLGDGSELSAGSIDVDAMTSAALNGKANATGAIAVDAGMALTTGAASELSAVSIALNGQSVTTSGNATAAQGLTVTVGTGGARNSGSLSGTDVTLTSAAVLKNDGKISASDLAQLTAATTLATGAASETFGNDVTLSSASATLDGVIKADDALSITTTSGNLIVNGTLAGNSTTLTSAADLTNNGAMAGTVSAALTATDTLTTSAGSEVSGGDVDLTGRTITTNGTAVATITLDLNAGTGGIDNGGVLIGPVTTLTSEAGIVNRGTVTGTNTGTLTAATSLQTDAGSSVYGDLITLSGLSVAANGVVNADNVLNITAGSGGFEAAGDLSAVTTTINSDAGITLTGVLDTSQDATLIASGAYTASSDASLYGRNIAITAASFDNAGEILADQTATLTSTSDLLTNTGLIGGSDVALTSANTFSNAGRIAALSDVDVTVATLSSTTNGSEISGVNVSLDASGVQNAGNMVAQAVLDIDAGTSGLSNGGNLIGTTTTLTSDARLTNAGTITGSASATLSAATTLQTDAGSALYGDVIALNGSTLSIDGIVAALTSVTATAETGNLIVDGDVSGNTLSLSSSHNITQNGVIDAVGATKITAEGSYTSGTDAALYGDTVSLTAADISNAGDILALNSTTLASLSGNIQNSGLIAGAKTSLTSVDDLTSSGTLAGSTSLTLTVQNTLTTEAGSETSGGALSLDATTIDAAGVVAAASTLDLNAGIGGITNSGDLIGETARLTSDAGIFNSGSITGRTLASLTMADAFELGTDFAVYGTSIEVTASAISANGVVAADEALTLNAGTRGLSNSGTLSAQNVTLTSQSSIENMGIVSAGDQLIVDSETTLTNAATLISGNDLAIYADQILNNGGVIWANDSIMLAANAALDPASLVQNTGGRIEAFQGDLIVRGDEVANLGTAPTIGASEIIKWLEQGSSGPSDPVEELSKLIDPTYLDADGNILPAYTAEYAALWADVINGGDTLSADAQSILKSGVTTPSGTALKSDFAGLWEDMFAKANADGTPDPAALVASMVDPAIFDVDGSVLPAHANAYAALWVTLASGGTSVSDTVKDILDPSALIVESTSTDPVTGVITTTYSNDLVSDNTDVWAAMSAGSGAAYDIVKILYQDRFNDDGVLAEMVAGGTVDIEADEVRNIFGNISAGEDLFITANTVTNQAMGASQVLLEVHKKPGCFTCHEGEVDFYDTFGGRIEAVGSVSIAGNLTNVTLNSSELTLQDVMNEMNAYIEEQQAAGDADLAGVPLVAGNNFHFEEHRDDNFTAPVEGNGTDIRDVAAIDTGSDTVVDTGDGTPDVTTTDVATVETTDAQTGSGTPSVTTTNVEEVSTVTVDTGTGTPTVIPIDPSSYSTTVEVVTSVTPTLTPTARVDALFSAGLNTLAETNTEFTDYANYITSNYMMDVDRLQYRDGLINNTFETALGALTKANVITDVGNLDYLNQPILIPAADGSGMKTIYPAATSLELNGKGALISGSTVAISGDAIDNSGAILASLDASITANDITGTGGTITADAGEVALTALGSIDFEDVTIGGASVDIIAGQDFTGKGVAISSETDTSIFAVTGVTLTSLENEYELNRSRTNTNPFTGETTTTITSTLTATEQVTSSLTAGGDLSIITSGDLALAGVLGDVGGSTTLSAGGDLLLTAVQSTAEFHSGNSKNGTDIQSDTSHVTELNTGGDFTATAGGKAVLVGTQIDAGGTVQLAAAEDVVLAAAQDIYTYETRSSKKSGLFGFKKKSSSHSITELTNEGVRIAASGDVEVIAETGALTTAGTSFVSNNGDINLSAVEGDIYAGIYTDIFQEEKKKSSSLFWGLISSSSQLNTVDQFNTGTDALAALDLSLVSGEDTTLVGATLSAGQNLNINTGGDFSVQAAIDSQRSEFFSSNMGMVTTTTIQERSFVETAVFTQLLAGQQINLGIDGTAELVVYEQSGVDAPNLEELYPEELLALAGLNLISQDLANEYFYDKQTSLSPAFKTLVSIAVGNFVVPGLGISSMLGSSAPSWLVTGTEAFASSFIVGSLDSVVSGDFDLGAILEGAVFSGVSAGLTAGINIDDLGITLGENAFDPLLGFGSGHFSIGNILERGLDNVITASLDSAVYGTDFGSNFISSFGQTLLTLAQNDVQNLIGASFDAGSFGSVLSHSALGCLVAEAGGADCASGVLGAVTEQVYASVVGGNAPQVGTAEYEAWKAENAQNLTLISATIGWVFSGGEAANVNATSDYAVSAFEHNYLTSEQRERADELLAILDEYRQLAARCGNANFCFVPPELIQALEAAGYTDHNLSSGMNSYFALMSFERNTGAVIGTAIETLRQTSLENTRHMMTACAGDAITAACADHLDAAEDFLTWENESWFDSRGLFSVGSDTLHQHLEYGRDLDQLIVDEMREVQAGNQSLTDARVAIVTRASSYDGGMNLFMSGVTAAGVGLVCYGTAGVGCALAAGAGVIGQGDELVDGTVTLVNGVPTQNPTEAALIAAGATPEQAAQIESWIDIGATVVDLGGGVVIAVKSGQLVDDAVRLTGPRATADDVVVQPPPSGGSGSIIDDVVETDGSGPKISQNTIDNAAGSAPNSATIGGKTCVYSCVVDGTTRYVGITDDIARRGRDHLRQKNIEIEGIAGLDNLSRADARAVEQTLINYYGLGKDGGTLLNKINSISPTKNPTAYEQSLIRGKELLDSVDYQWTQ